jgi:phage-related holin
MANLTFEIPSGIQWIVYLIVVDVILGIVAAIVKKEFRLGKLAKFMGVPVLGYVFGYVVLVNILGTTSYLTWAALCLIVLALVGSILNNLGRLGLKVPDWLKK